MHAENEPTVPPLSPSPPKRRVQHGRLLRGGFRGPPRTFVRPGLPRIDPEEE